MKDSQLQKQKKETKKNNLFSKASQYYSSIHIYHLLIVVFGLNILAAFFVVMYVSQLTKLILPQTPTKFLEIKSIPNLPANSDSINASAAAYVVYDTESRSVVAGKNQNLRFTPASTAKIMTATLALEYYSLDQVLTIPDLSPVEGSSMDLISGEKLRVLDLLYGLMLPSGNDAAYTLAYYYPGGRRGFVEKMNSKAKELGLTNTHFEDPAGYIDSNYSTAVELARLATYAMDNPTFRTIVKTRNITVYDSTYQHEYYLENLNQLLVYPHVLGVKTGFTNEAGGVLVTAISHEGKILIVVVLKSNDRFYDTQDLMKFINEKVTFSLP